MIPERPWMSVQDIAFIDALLKSAPLRVLEFGCGGSTVYFGPKAKTWYFVEHNEDWYHAVWEKLIKNKMKFNARLVHDLQEYASVYESEDLDLIIVDGVKRTQCIAAAYDRGALVICHDGRRTEYLEEARKYKAHRKVGDDLLIMSNVKFPRFVIDILKRFDLRNINEGSNPWDPRHPSDYAPFCGFQHPSTLNCELG